MSPASRGMGTVTQTDGINHYNSQLGAGLQSPSLFCQEASSEKGGRAAINGEAPQADG